MGRIDFRRLDHFAFLCFSIVSELFVLSKCDHVLVLDVFLNKFLDKDCISPNALYLFCAINEQPFAVFYVIFELSYVDSAIRIDLLGVLVAGAIVEMAYDLGPIEQGIATIPSQRRILEFP